MKMTEAYVPGCHFHGQKLDRHLVGNHIELSQKQRQVYSDRAKKEEAIDQLGKLRASDPAIPIVSQLDLQASEGGSPEGADEAGGPQQEVAAEIEEEAGPRPVKRKKWPLRRGEKEKEKEKEKEDEPGSAQRKMLFSGSGKGSTVHFITFPDSSGKNYLDEYRKFQLGVEPTDKQEENVTLKISQIKAFLEYLYILSI
ncbi:hypothetical protein AAFF_G00198230 [Aldrovandia affinis]|uniref:Uncharacterized protein n=1 Tax=Aldrovandia affinis TaxID=143900 RepID=A0AAD7W5B5_9TELE|nr:hypothetical protein AAFF_G00198230 [Aldrovandia affinis]